MTGPPRPIYWVGTSLDDLRTFPEPVREELGYALFLAQLGRKHRSAKPMKGHGGAHVLEALSDHRGDTFRAVYTVRFRHAVYVLHAFQKKSKKGIATPLRELRIMKKRLEIAEHHYHHWKTSHD